MSRELWKLQRSMRRIIGRPGLRICAELELGLSLEQSGAWGVHRPGLVVVAAGSRRGLKSHGRWWQQTAQNTRRCFSDRNGRFFGGA